MKPKLEYASHGAFVAEAQTKLNLLLPAVIPQLKVDGKYGDKTVTRVKQFQKSRGLVADGMVGAKTWAALDGVASAPTDPGAPPGPNPAAQLLNKGKPVHFGSRMRCSQGTKPSVLMLTSSPTKPATVGDCQGFLNIPSFGNCYSDLNPNYMPPTTFDDPLLGASFTSGSVGRPQCTPVIMTPWIGAFTKAGAVDTSQAIDKTATCKCKFGGTIHFT